MKTIGLNTKEMIRHSKAAVLKSVLDKSKEAGINMSDLRIFIYDELEKLDFYDYAGNLESVK